MNHVVVDNNINMKINQPLSQKHICTAHSLSNTALLWEKY